MDLFDFQKILELMQAGPHNLIQIVLLALIWLQSRGVRREIHSLREELTAEKVKDDSRFLQIELRLSKLENKGGANAVSPA